MKRPNIVLIMTDQQRADFFASEGFALDTMPFVDSLRGARFSRAYTPNPTCSPARCSLLSGRFPSATRVRENGGVQNIFRGDDLLDVLRANDYARYLAGKNHSYRHNSDFDAAVDYHHTGVHGDNKNAQEAEFDRWLHDLDHGVSQVPTPFPLESQLPSRIVRDAIEQLENHDTEKPFFLWLSFPEPHNPYQVPEPYFSLFPENAVPAPQTTPADGARKGPKWRWMQNLVEEKRPGFQDDWRRYRANYCGMIRLIDDQIRRFMEHIEALGLYDDTLFIFTSDHGDYAGDYGLQRKGVGLPECLVRVPLLFHGPQVLADGLRDEFVSLVDIFPTICEMIGAKIPYGVQGRSLWPLLTAQPFESENFSSIYTEVGFGGEFYEENERPPLHFSYQGATFDELNSFTQSGRLKMVRQGDWKLLFDHTGHGELYDLRHDPHELNDLYSAPNLRDVRLQLTETMLRWTLRAEDPLPTGKYTPKTVA